MNNNDPKISSSETTTTIDLTIKTNDELLNEIEHTPLPTHTPIALALSGGGIRAMVFHLGVLKNLAEQNRLEDIEHISTVSGGSLIIGLILETNNMQWPSSQYFLNNTIPQLKKNLCSKSIVKGMFFQLKKPSNFKFLLSRANLLAATLYEEWGINIQLRDIPDKPKWHINATTAENGKRFRFKKDSFGDYKLGYVDALKQDFLLCKAIAVSAAFPGGIGPLVINTKNYIWKMREWEASYGSEIEITPDYSHVHIYDGGVYDNLGLEPFFDIGTQQKKYVISQNNTVIIVSDAGAPLSDNFMFGILNPWRLKHITDIISEQSRSLRVRSFMNYLINNKNQAKYLYIKDKNIKNGNSDFTVKFPTTFRQLNDLEFDKIFNHGYNISKLNIIQ